MLWWIDKVMIRLSSISLLVTSSDRSGVGVMVTGGRHSHTRHVMNRISCNAPSSWNLSTSALTTGELMRYRRRASAQKGKEIGMRMRGKMRVSGDRDRGEGKLKCRRR